MADDSAQTNHVGEDPFQIAGKKITVMGLGLLGRQVGDIAYLAEQGAELIVTDLKTEEELAPSLAQLVGYPNITYVLGEHRLEDFRDRDLIAKAAGVPLDSPFLKEAQRNSIPIKMSAAWLVQVVRKKFPDVKTVGVTGTRGKSTVTHLLYDIFARAGRHVVLGGNVRGVANLPLIDELTSDSILLLELDSWQLQGFGDLSLSPYIAIFTTFYRDHMNYYRDDMDAYLYDKSRIFAFQSPEDHLIIGRQALDILREKHAPELLADITVAGEASVPSEWDVLTPGVHNRYNAGIAMKVADVLGIDTSTVRSVLAEFPGAFGRLSLVRTVDGVTYYNDTTATTPEAACAALAALDTKETTGARNVVLIAGGVSKGLNMQPFAEAICERAKACVLLDESGTQEIADAVLSCPTIESSLEPDLPSCVAKAREYAEPGDVIVLSPGFASFGKFFKNEFDRGEQFEALV